MSLQNIKWHLESIRNAKSFSVLGPPQLALPVEFLFEILYVGAHPNSHIIVS
ncbi:hypothetical protein B8A07_12025 [Staphylococcus aureus]|nr:hypothetical protein B8A07_12025 [Staphylococcus aureus]